MELTYEQREDIGLAYVRELLEPVCPYGKKRLREEGFYAPSERAALERELDNVETLCAALEADKRAVLELRHALSGLKDLSGTLRGCEDRDLGETELFELTAFCLRLRALIPGAEAMPGYGGLEGVRFEAVDGALEILDPADSGRLSFYVEDGRSAALREARETKRALERELRQPGADREALLVRRMEAVKAEERALDRIYSEMSAALRPYLPALRRNTESAGRLDAGLAKALLARRFGCVRPETGGETLRIVEAVHPQIAAALEARGRRFTPITAELPRGVTVLTGANMGGKSVALKTLVLNAALALSGCFVFCRAATVPMFARLELINRDFSDAEGGLSSFGGEILRFNAAAEALREGELSFLAMDEFARGTNAREGAAIARAVVKYLADKPAVTLLATHYDGTARYAARHYQVKGLRRLNETEPEGTGADGLRRIEQAMDYGLLSVDPGADCPRDALRICRLLGMDAGILAEAEKESS